VEKRINSLRKKNKKATHAGGVVFREKNGHKEFLLVSAKNFPFIWVLPKGHIKKSETEVKAAIREVKEESGIKAAIISKIGNAERRRWNFRKQVVAFYQMRYEAEFEKNKENRKIEWLSLDDAINKLFYCDQKEILKKLGGLSGIFTAIINAYL